MADAADVMRAAVDCWNRKDMDGYRACLHPDDYSYMGGDGVEHQGVDAGMAVAEMFANAFPDGKIEITNLHTAGDTVVMEFIGRGTHTGELMGIPATGRTMEINVCDVATVRDGKICAEREYMDQMVIMSQLGVASAPAA